MQESVWIILPVILYPAVVCLVILTFPGFIRAKLLFVDFAAQFLKKEPFGGRFPSIDMIFVRTYRGSYHLLSN